MAAQSDRHALIRALEDAERLVANLKAALATLPTDDPLAPIIEADEMSLKVAAFDTGKSTDTIRRWAKTHGIGRKIGGTWLISRRKLRAVKLADFA